MNPFELSISATAKASQGCEWLTTEEAAARLRVSKSWLEKMRHPGRSGPPFTKMGRSVRYSAQLLDLWAQQQTFNGVGGN